MLFTQFSWEQVIYKLEKMVSSSTEKHLKQRTKAKLCNRYLQFYIVCNKVRELTKSTMYNVSTHFFFSFLVSDLAWWIDIIIYTLKRDGFSELWDLIKFCVRSTLEFCYLQSTIQYVLPLSFNIFNHSSVQTDNF